MYKEANVAVWLYNKSQNQNWKVVQWVQDKQRLFFPETVQLNCAHTAYYSVYSHGNISVYPHPHPILKRPMSTQPYLVWWCQGRQGEEEIAATVEAERGEPGWAMTRRLNKTRQGQGHNNRGQVNGKYDAGDSSCLRTGYLVLIFALHLTLAFLSCRCLPNIRFHNLFCCSCKKYIPLKLLMIQLPLRSKKFRSI